MACKSAVNVLEEQRSKRQLGKFEDCTLMVGEKRVAFPISDIDNFVVYRKHNGPLGQMEKQELMSTERMINNLESDGSFKDNGRQRKMSDKQ